MPRKKIEPLIEEDHPEEEAVTKKHRTKKKVFAKTEFSDQEIDDARVLLEYTRTRNILPNIN